MARLGGTGSDDTMPAVTVRDIAAGLNTHDGILNLPPNMTFSSANVIAFEGRTLYIGGFSEIVAAGIATGADASQQFYDANGGKHILEWRGGNLYDTVNGVLTTIGTAVYDPGSAIGHADQGGILYWCTNNVPLQACNGVTTVPVVSSSKVGAVAIPTGTYLTFYAGSLIVANPGIGGVQNPGSILPSNVNDTTTFIGANLTATGANNFLQAMISMGVAAGGVPPTNSVMLLGSQSLILAQGPVNSFKLNSVNIPMGCQDGNSAQYIPTGDLLGVVIFLGNDNQFWMTNGITGECVTSKLLDFLNVTIEQNKEINPNQRFSGCYNARYQYYLCDLGQNLQMAFRWKNKAWYQVVGWPSGFYCNGTTGVGFPANYVASSSSTTSPGMYLTGQDNTSFNGITPSIFFQTGYQTAGDESMMKEWQYVNLTMNNQIPTAYQVTAIGIANSGNTNPVSNPLVFLNPTAIAAVMSPYATWDVSKWDQGLWGPGLTSQPQTPFIAQGLFTAPVPVTPWTAPGLTQPLRSSAVTFKIAWTTNGVANAIPNFDIFNFKVRYKEMGRLMVGGAQYSNESGTSGTAFPFV